MYFNRPKDFLAFDGWIEWLSRQVHSLPKEARSFVKSDEFKAYGFTDARHTRHPNQDRVALAARVGAPARDNWFMAIVCDGVGGSAHGERAASLATATLIAEVAIASRSVSPVDVLQVAISRTHSRVFHVLDGKSATTIVAALVQSNGSAVGWVGDSRIYSLGGSKLQQVSTDDTLRAALDASSKILANSLNDEFADRLSQAVGGELPVRPHVVPWNPKTMGGCLLCTDGVWKPLESTLSTLVANCREDAGELARRLLLSSDWYGGQDNATAILLPSLEAVVEELHRPEGLPDQALQIFLPNARFVCRPPDFAQSGVGSGLSSGPFASGLANRRVDAASTITTVKSALHATSPVGTPSHPNDTSDATMSGEAKQTTSVGQSEIPTGDLETSAEPLPTPRRNKAKRTRAGPAQPKANESKKKKTIDAPPLLRIIEESFDETDPGTPDQIPKNNQGT